MVIQTNNISSPLEDRDNIRLQKFHVLSYKLYTLKLFNG